MEKHIGPRTAIVSSKELGTNCWLAERFVEGTRCGRVSTCSYPEKKTCKAVHAEIAYLKERQRQLLKQASDIDAKVEEVTKMLEK